MYPHAGSADFDGRVVELDKLEWCLKHGNTNAELSILRGITPIYEDETNSDKKEKDHLQKDPQPCEDDTELDIIMDTRMIKEIDLSEAALRDISRRIEEKKNTLSDIEQQMNDVFTLLTSSGEYGALSQQGKEPIGILGSIGSEWTQGLVSPNHPRDGDTRILSPNKDNMDMDNELEINLQPQRSRSLSGVPALRSLGRDEVANLLSMDSLSTMQGESEARRKSLREEELKTPSTKRKARSSPGAPSPSDKETGQVSPAMGVTRKTTIRKRKIRTKKICRNTEQATNPLLDSSFTESLDEFEESGGKNEETPEEKDDNMESTTKPRRITRLSGKTEDRERIQVISSDEEDSMAVISSASSIKETRGRKNKEYNKNKNKTRNITTRKDSLGEEGSLDLTNEDRINETGNIDKPHERGKGLTYKLPNKISQNNRQNKVDYGLWTTHEDRITGLKDVVECLVDKIEAQGDIKQLQKERLEAGTENKRLKKDINKLEQIINQKDKETEGIKLMYEEIEEKYIQMEGNRKKEMKLLDGNPVASKEDMKVRNLLQDTYALVKEDEPVFRSPIKGVRKQLPITGKKFKHPETFSLTPHGGIGVIRDISETDYTAFLAAGDMDTITPTREYANEQRSELGITNSDKEKVNEISRQIRMLNEERKFLTRKRKDRIEENKEKPRITGNVQLIPPRHTYKQGTTRDNPNNQELSEDHDPYVEEQTREYLNTRETVRNRRPSDKSTRRNSNRGADPRTGIRIRKPPKNAVVAIRTRDETTSYAAILKKARQEVSLGELGIETTRIKKGINGNLLIEIPGTEGKKKAKILAEKLQEKLGDEEVAITRPTAMGEIRITGLDESVTVEEVKHLITETGGCNNDEVRISPIRRMYNGMGSVWIRCPLVSANALAQTGKIKIGQ
ncbi:uncharacterized protein LOC109610185 [Camponotus floridanus]|uniref:uncharacterized protein LOC109610185 n=1 Tax=Camponotus floridanus TaxID=104421 RepID=UPI000DC675D5|nr:uncharacterized protein LOC109610185 [Camponotus floridanus]